MRVLLYKGEFEMSETKYFVRNNIEVVEVKILKEQGSFVVIQLPCSEGAIRVRNTKLYNTKEDAEKTLPKKEKILKWHYD